MACCTACRGESRFEGGRPKEEEEETSFEMLKVKKKKTRSKMRTMEMRVSLRVMMWSILNLRVKIQVGLSIRSIR